MRMKRIKIPIKIYDPLMLSTITKKLQKNGYTVKNGVAIEEGYSAEIPLLVRECKEIIASSNPSLTQSPTFGGLFLKKGEQ